MPQAATTDAAGHAARVDELSAALAAAEQAQAELRDELSEAKASAKVLQAK